MLKNILKEEKKILVFLFLSVSLTLVCIPRFDRADYGFIKNFVGNEYLYEGLPYDILIYKNYIEYFRGEKNDNAVHPPYTYRILVPYVASKLPFAPLTSLNLTNLFFLYIGLIFLYLTLIKLSVGFRLAVIGCFIYIFSFPVFYYATSGYIDGTLVGLLTTGVYFIISRKFYWFMLLLMIGTLANEKFIIIFPFLITYFYVKKIRVKNSILILISSVFIYLMVSYILRNYTVSSSVSYLWIPGSKYILLNIYRPKTYFSFLLTLGIPGVIVFISLFKFSKDEIKKYSYFYIGCLTSVILYIYAILSAWSDGRTLWTMYPFAIPLSVLFIESLEKRRVELIQTNCNSK